MKKSSFFQFLHFQILKAYRKNEKTLCLKTNTQENKKANFSKNKKHQSMHKETAQN